MPVRRLDDCLDRWKCERIDLMKMDVEGYEGFVLDGASAALAQGRIRRLLCEFNDFCLPLAGTSAERLYQRVLDLGFRDVTGTRRPPGSKLFNRCFELAGT